MPGRAIDLLHVSTCSTYARFRELNLRLVRSRANVDVALPRVVGGEQRAALLPYFLRRLSRSPPP